MNTDGCKRYVLELLKGIYKQENEWGDKWEIEIYLGGNIYTFDEIKHVFLANTGQLLTTKNDSAPSSFYIKYKKNTSKFLHNTLPIKIFTRLVKFKHNQHFFRKKAEHRIRKFFKLNETKYKLGEYDLVHFPIPLNFLYPYSEKTKIITTVHDFTHKLFPEFHLSSNVWNTQLGIDYSLKVNSYWIAISESTKSDLINFCKVAPSKICSISEAADTSIFKPCLDELELQRVLKKYKIPDKPFFLSLSTLEPRKNIANTIKAFKLLLSEHPDFDVYMVVSGKVGWKMNKLLNDNSSEKTNRIIFTGYVDEVDLPKLYSKARALTYVSFYEGFGLPPLEAMSCGTPVIYGNNSSQLEIVGTAGLPANPVSVVDIKNQLFKLYTDEKVFQDFKVRALARSTEFSWDKCVKETLAYYESVLYS